MTDEEIREFRLKVLEKDLASINNRLHHAFNRGFELGRKSTTPKEKTGRWINEKWHGTDLIGVTCSNCHIVENRFSAYCPNCGARMEVKND